MRRGLLALCGLLLLSCDALVAPGPTPAPTVTEFVIPTRSPAPSVSPTPFTGHYGLLVASGSGYALRREGDATTIATIALVSGAVSPDGRRLAGFTAAAPYELRVVDLASPSTSALVAPVGGDERPGAIAWSTDGTGLVYSVTPTEPGSRGGPAWGALRTIDLATRSAKEVTRVDGVALRPVLWDRLGGDLVAAFAVRGDVATDYVVVRGVAAPARRTLPDKPWRPTVSGDGRWMLIAAAGEPTYRTFQADDPSFVVETHGLTDAPVTAAGRPMNADIGVVLDRELILWDPSTGLRRRVPTTAAVDAIVGFRFDGSAAIVRTASGLALLDIASGVLAPLAGDAGLGAALP